MGRLDAAALDAAYAAAFRDYGADVEVGKEGEAGKVLFRSGLRVELAAALDEWANLRRGAEPLRGKDWRALLTIANLADNDPKGARLREERANERLVSLVWMASSGEVENLPLPTMLNLAGALLEFGGAPGAVRILRRARERHPDDVYVHIALSGALANLKPPRIAEAARHARAALALQPSSVALRAALAAALAGAGDWSSAAAAWDAIARGQPEDHWAHERLSEALNYVGDLDGAITTGQRAVTLDPQCADGHSILLDALGARADAAAYRTHGEAAIQRFPADPGLLAHVAWARWRCGDATGALAAAEEAVRAAPSDPRGCQALAGLLIVFGQPDRAVKVMQAAVDAHPGHLAAERALARAAATETGQMLDAESQFARRAQWNAADTVSSSAAPNSPST